MKSNAFNINWRRLFAALRLPDKFRVVLAKSQCFIERASRATAAAHCTFHSFILRDYYCSLEHWNDSRKSAKNNLRASCALSHNGANRITDTNSTNRHDTHIRRDEKTRFEQSSALCAERIAIAGSICYAMAHIASVLGKRGCTGIPNVIRLYSTAFFTNHWTMLCAHTKANLIWTQQKKEKKRTEKSTKNNSIFEWVAVTRHKFIQNSIHLTFSLSLLPSGLAHAMLRKKKKKIVGLFCVAFSLHWESWCGNPLNLLKYVPFVSILPLVEHKQQNTTARGVTEITGWKKNQTKIINNNETAKTNKMKDKQLSRCNLFWHCKLSSCSTLSHSDLLNVLPSGPYQAANGVHIWSS